MPDDVEHVDVLATTAPDEPLYFGDGVPLPVSRPAYWRQSWWTRLWAWVLHVLVGSLGRGPGWHP